MNNFKVITFNVGQGDHSLIELPSGEFGIIDFYYDKVISYLNYQDECLPAVHYLQNKFSGRLHEIRIAFILISHYHLDHLKGLPKLLNFILDYNIPLGKILFPGLESKEDILSQLEEGFQTLEFENQIIKDKMVTRKSVLQNIIKTLNDFIQKRKIVPTFLTGPRPLFVNQSESDKELNINSANFFCVGPSTNFVREYSQKTYFRFFYDIVLAKFEKINLPQYQLDENELSVIFKIDCGGFSLLFTGDATDYLLVDSFKNFQEAFTGFENISLNSDFIKVPHHGSSKSSSPFVWQSILKPKEASYLVISAGNHKGYNHPHEKVFSDIKSTLNTKKSNVYIYSTNNKIFSDYGDLFPSYNYFPDDWKTLSMTQTIEEVSTSPIDTNTLFSIDSTFKGIGFQFEFSYWNEHRIVVICIMSYPFSPY